MNYGAITEITLKMIVDTGILKPGTALFAEGLPQVSAHLNSDGSLSITVDGKSSQHEYPSGAARSIMKLSVNGWKFWKFEYQGVSKELSYARELYKQKFHQASEDGKV